MMMRQARRFDVRAVQSGDLERAFRRRRAFERLRREKKGLWVGLAFSLGVASIRAMGIGVSPEGVFTLSLRFFIAFIFLALMVMAARWPRRYVRRHDQILGGALLLAASCYLVVRFGAILDGSQAIAAPTLTTVIAHLLLLSFAGLSIPWLVIVTLPLDIAIVGSFLILEASESALILFLLVVATIGGVLARLELDGRSRQVFYQQRALRDAQAQIAARQRMLLDAIDKKERLLSFIAHDMRQPLMSLAIHRESLSRAVDAGNFKRVSSSVEAIGECIRFMQLNTDRLLEAPDADGVTTRAVGEVDVRALVDGIVSMSAARAAVAGVALRVCGSRRGDARIGLSDESMLAEVFSNLIDNGIKYRADSQKGRRCWVLIGIVRGATSLRIDVIDNGIGMSRHTLEQIFDFGWRDGGVVSSGQVAGQGLGLASVAAALRTLPGHRISVSSRVGTGSRFSVHLPRAGGAGHLPA